MKRFESKYKSFIFYYTLFFAVYTLFGRVALLHAGVQGTLNSVIYVGVAGLGLVLVFIDLCFYRNFTAMKYYPLYILFIICAIISSVLNYKYGISSNASTIGWLIVQMGLFTTMGHHFSDEIYHKWLSYFCIFSGEIWAIASSVSLYQFLFVKGYRVFLNERHIRQSFYDNRLFGLFIDPNLGAFVGFLVILGMIYLMYTYKNKLTYILCSINCVLQLLYIILSGSRSTEVCMVVSLSYLFIYLLVKKYKKCKRSLPFRVISYILVPVVIAGITLGLFSGIKEISHNLALSVSADLHSDENEFERTDITDDASNNRSDIWKGYFELTKDKPIFGLSPRNAWEYADKVHPGSYICEHHYDVHNAYIAVGAGMGIVGLIVLAVIIFCILKCILPRLFDTEKMTPQYFAALQLILNIAVFICFYPGIFFTNGIDTVLFWPAIGFVLKDVKGTHFLRYK